MTEVQRQAWCADVIAWAVDAGASLLRDGVTLGSVRSDWVRVVYEVPEGERVNGNRWGAEWAELPVVGDPTRADVFDRKALELVGKVAREVEGERRDRVAVYVGRLLVYVWAVEPGGAEATLMWIADAATRADVERQ